MKIDRLQNDERLRQFVRFGVVGVLSSAGFVGNYFFTNCYTFRTKPSWKHFAGFAGSHAVNFGLHVVLFNIFLWLGMHQLVIPVFVMGICVIVQFTILRWVFTKHE